MLWPLISFIMSWVQSVMDHNIEMKQLLLSVGLAVPRLMYCSLPRLIVITPLWFPPFISRGAPRQMAWGTSISERWNYGQEITDQYSLKWWLPCYCRILLHAAKLRHGTLLRLWRKACWGFFSPKNLTASAGFEPVNLDTRGQHDNH
jgi:hypothetical protein